MKERRRLIDETKTTGREVKSNWQHFESMEFLATHLRLPINGSGRSSSVQLTDDDEQRYSEGSPPNQILSPPSLPDLSVTKTELDNKPANINTWSLPSDNDKPRSTESTEQFKPLAPPPHYPGLLNRVTAPPPFPHHSLWAMWSNSIAQAHAQQQQQQQQQQLQTLNNNQRPPESTTSHPSPAVSDVAVCNEADSEPPTKKKRRLSQDVNINVSIKDLAVPEEKYSEYHFCISLAQMMESVPAAQRPDLKIKLIQLITANAPPRDNHSEGSLSL